MTTLDLKITRRFRISTVYATTLGIGLALGLISGSAFAWTTLDKAWAIYIGGFLSTLMVAASVVALRSVCERLRRGEWWRGIYLGCSTIFPLTTLYLGGSALIAAFAPAQHMVLSSGARVASRPDLLTMAPMIYTSSLFLALVIGLLYVLTSPFKPIYQAWRRRHVAQNGALPQVVFPPIYRGKGDPYAAGSLNVRTVNVVEGELGAPVAMQIHTPEAAGTYAVVVFLHGFMLSNAYFSTILRHLASHGFVVVAPQMHGTEGTPLSKPGTSYEAELAMQLLDWMPDHLSNIAGVTADLQRLGLAGHSRGGKVVWRLLKADPTCAQAVAGIDPVDGTGGPLGLDRRIAQKPFSFKLPSLVIGTDLGQVMSGPLGASCAPKGDNHEQFYTASSGPAWHVVALDHGHLDMLDDHRPGCRLRCAFCLKGRHKAGMRKLTGGLLTAFFRGNLQDDTGAYSYLRDETRAPIPVRIRVK